MSARRREQNRLSAARSRKRKADYVKQLETDIGVLLEEIEYLKDKLRVLEKEIKTDNR